MSRARMSNLASVLLAPENRAEAVPAVQEEKASIPKAGIQKAEKPVFGKVSETRIAPKRGKQEPPSEMTVVHRAYGERGDFEKVTVTLPSDVRGMLLEESLRRKKARSSDWPIAAIVREAIAAYLRPK